jgi:hypothetical protein
MNASLVTKEMLIKITLDTTTPSFKWSEEKVAFGKY